MKIKKNFSALREGDWIILVHKRPNGKFEVLNNQPQQYFKECLRLTDWGGNKLIGYFQVPPNCVERPKLWESEFRGDELPAKDCTCMVSVQNANGAIFVRAATYIAKLGRFLGEEPLAFIPLTTR